MITFDRVSFTYNNAGVDAGVHDINLDIPEARLFFSAAAQAAERRR